MAFSQAKDYKKIHGKITAGKASVEGVEVVNFSNGTMTNANSKGEFDILARPSDVLMFSSPNLEYKRKTLNKDEFTAGTVQIVMEPKVTELDEVVVEKSDNLNETQFSVAKPTKVYTQAERKLRTAAKPLDQIQGLGISNDAILNLLSGRTKMLKKEVQVEREVKMMEKLDDLYEDNYYIESLNIQKDYIKGFKYFIVSDAAFAKALNENNNLQIKGTMIALAEKYNKMLADEK